MFTSIKSVAYATFVTATTAAVVLVANPAFAVVHDLIKKP